MTTEPTGLIAILRGLTPAEAPAIGETLYTAGFRRIEVPLNSPEPLDSIRELRGLLPDDCLIGAGTVLSVDDVAAVAEAGGQMVVAPNMDTAVIAAAVERGLSAYPGVATATEAFAALDAGATALKLFPADTIGVSGMRAWAGVLPADTQMLPVGGVDAANLDAWLVAGAAGAGIGSCLYTPGDGPEGVRSRARDLVAIWAEHIG
jgi:2-dehydro-3-deoxyphosphogalactonate aldolase